MKKKLPYIILVSSIVFLASLGTVQANLVCNHSFEIDEDPADGYPDGWSIWSSLPGQSFGGDDVTFVNDAEGAHHGDWYFQALGGIWGSFATPTGGPGDTRLMVPISPSPGGRYAVGGYAKDLMPGGSPSDSPPGSEVIYYDSDGVRVGDSAGRPYKHTIFEDIPRDGEYHLFYGYSKYPINLPSETAYLTASCWVEPDSEYAFDDMFTTYPLDPPPVYDPEPADKAHGVSPDIQILTWRRFKYYCQRYAKCEVWWGTQDDPNFWIQPHKKIMELSDANHVDLSAIPPALGGPISLEPETEYYWKLLYEEPNDCNWGAELISNVVWYFETSGPVADINSSGRVDLVDFAILGSQWQGIPGTPSADIAPAGGDNFVDMQDLKALARVWLWP